MSGNARSHKVTQESHPGGRTTVRCETIQCLDRWHLTPAGSTRFRYYLRVIGVVSPNLSLNRCERTPTVHDSLRRFDKLRPIGRPVVCAALARTGSLDRPPQWSGVRRQSPGEGKRVAMGAEPQLEFWL